jgi:hypothetical protein
MGLCVCSEDRKAGMPEFDIFTQYQGIKQISQNSHCETKLVADRQTREVFALHNVYSESPKHPNALEKEEVFNMFDTLRRWKHLNIASIWQVSHSKLDLVYVI